MEIESEVARVVRLQKESVLRVEAAVMRELTRRWLDVERALEAELLKTALALQEGKITSEAMILRNTRFQNLMYQARAHYSRFANDFENRVAELQGTNLELGVNDAAKALRAGMREAGLGINFEMLNVDAIDTMIGFSADGSPLRNLLMKSYGEAVNGILRELTSGLAKGLGVKDVAKNMANGFGVGLQRALLIARTEILRSYRMGTQEQYRSSGLVTQYKRLAVKDDRTCLGCLMQDGEVFENAEDFAEHPNGRCTLVAIVRGGFAPTWVSGKEWLQGLPEERQRKILGDARFEVWRSGQVTLDQMSKLKTDAVWGGSFVPTPVRDLVIGSE